MRMPKKAAAKRELIDTVADKRYVRRDEKGQFKESDDVGQSTAAARRQHAQTKARKRHGDRRRPVRDAERNRTRPRVAGELPLLKVIDFEVFGESLGR